MPYWIAALLLFALLAVLLFVFAVPLALAVLLLVATVLVAVRIVQPVGQCRSGKAAATHAVGPAWSWSAQHAAGPAA